MDYSYNRLYEKTQYRTVLFKNKIEKHRPLFRGVKGCIVLDQNIHSVPFTLYTKLICTNTRWRSQGRTNQANERLVFAAYHNSTIEKQYLTTLGK